MTLRVKPGCRFTFPAESVFGPVQGVPLPGGIGIEGHLRRTRHLDADEILLIDGELAGLVEEGPDVRKRGMLTPMRIPQAAMTIRSSTRLNPLGCPPVTGRSDAMVDEGWGPNLPRVYYFA